MIKFIIWGLSVFWATNSWAGVRMLGNSDSESKNEYSSSITFPPITNFTFNITDDQQWCLDNGYTDTSCTENIGIVVTCPKDNRYLHCCPPEYQYRKEFCESKGYIPSSETCMGYHYCIVPIPSSQEDAIIY